MNTLEQLINDKTDEFMKVLEKRGLYPVDGSVGVMSRQGFDEDTLDDLDSNKHELITMEEEGDLFIAGKFALKIGDFAWEERNLDPEGFESMKEIEEMMGLDEEDIIASTLNKSVEDWWDSD